MKAIHNALHTNCNYGCTVFNTTNIQNESNSQRLRENGKEQMNCIQYYKYTK